MLTPPAYGYQEVLGLRNETVYGTAVAPDVWIRPTSFDLMRKDPPIQMQGATGAAVPYLYSATLPRHTRGIPDISGTIVCEAEYDDFGWILQNAIGPQGSPANSDGTAYTHTFSMTSPHGTVPDSMTIARINGVEDLQYAGCMVNSLEISGKAGEIVSWSADFIAQSGGAIEVDDTIGTISAAPWIEGDEAEVQYDSTQNTALGAMTSQTGSNATPDWTYRVDNNLRVEGAAGVGARTIREPTYAGQRTASLTFSRDYYDDQFFNVIFPTTEPAGYVASAVKATSTVLAGASTAYHAMTLYIPCGLVMGEPTGYSGGNDILPETVVIEAAYNAVNPPTKAVLVNKTPTYATA